MDRLKPFVLGHCDTIGALLAMPTNEILPLIINNGYFNFITPLGNANQEQMRSICLFMIQGMQEFPAVAMPYMMNGGKLMSLLRKTNDVAILWVFAEMAKTEENMQHMLCFFEKAQACIIDVCVDAASNAGWTVDASMALLTMYHYLASRNPHRIMVMAQTKDAWGVLFHAGMHNKDDPDVMQLYSILARNLAVAKQWPERHAKELAGLLLHAALRIEDTLEHSGLALVLLSRNDPSLEKYCLGLGADRLMKFEQDFHDKWS